MKNTKIKHSFAGLVATAIGGGFAYIATSEYLSVGADVVYIADSDISRSFIWLVAGVVLLFVGLFYLIIASFH